jgi:Zn-dependent protease
MISDLTVDLVVMRVIAGVIMAMVQGLAIAATAVLLGDKGPRYDGRLTAWPWGHVDLVGLGSLALTGFGWGRPVAVDPGQLRFGRWGLVLIVLVSAAALLLLGFVLPPLASVLLRELDYTAGVTLAAFLREMAQLCVWMAIFSLLPIPPLAGAHFLTALGVSVPQRVAAYFGWALLLVSVFGVTRMVIRPAFNLIAPLILGTDASALA